MTALDIPADLLIAVWKHMVCRASPPLSGEHADKSHSYCNSILQCLYYSVPFRENVLNFPKRSTPDVVTAAAAKATPRPPPVQPNNAPTPKKSPNPSARNPGAPNTQPGQKPEDKDSPEYKKKQALLAGPVINMSYENADGYDMPSSLFTSLKDIFEAVVVSQHNMGVVSPVKFLEALRKENEMFRTSMHQDAHEFLNLLLNQVVESVEANAKAMELEKQSKALPNGSAAESQSISFPSTLNLPTTMRNTTRWVHELFEGTLTSETRCLTCENVSQRDEAFLDLSVDLDQHSSVTSCLRRFSEEEMLCERNKFHCDNCGGLQEAEKRMKIKRLPKILALHLKRFKYTEDLQRLQKLFHKVVYPYHLRLFNTTDDAEDPDRLYELYAVVVHIGGGPYHGHYVSIIKTEDRGWLLFDDEMVEPVDKSFVRNFFGDRPGLACAYVLFYQETTLEAVQREQEREESWHGYDESVSLGAHQNGTSEIQRIKSTPVPQSYEIDPMEAALDNLNHVTTSPGTYKSDPMLSSSPKISRSFTNPLNSKKSDVQSKKERAKEEKERKKAEKAAEKEKEKAEQLRRKELFEKRREEVKRQEDELQAAIAASKQSKVEEDGRRGVTDTPSTSMDSPKTIPRDTPKDTPKDTVKDTSLGMKTFRRSKSISAKLSVFAKSEKLEEAPKTEANGDAAQAAVPLPPAEPTEKEKKNRFSFRKKSFGISQGLSG